MSNGGVAAPSSDFNVNPSPRGGQGPFGAVPGPIGIPNPSGDLSRVYPNLSGTNNLVSGDIASMLRGELSPGTINRIHDIAAQFGVTSGMPLSDLANTKYARDIGISAEDQVNKGLQAYQGLVPTISSTQTVNPGLQAEIAGTNASNAAAPDPTQAASYARSLFEQYLNSFGGPQGGTGALSASSGGSIPWWQRATNAGGLNWGPTAGSETVIRRAPSIYAGP